MQLKIIHNYLNKLLIFIFPNKAGYWNSITPCSINKKPVELGRYYLDFISKIDFPDSFNEFGIPLYSFMGRDPIFHPTVISQYAFGIFEKLYEKHYKDEQLYNKFILLADWFVEHSLEVKGGKCWVIDIEYYPEYKLTKPWISSMAQGQAISVLTRAAKLTNNQIYEKIATEALEPFKFKVIEGGLVNHFNNIPVYEECPSPHKTMAVLNGWMFSLFGLYDLILLNNNKDAKELFYTGINSLKSILKYYDLNYWTQYYLFDYPKVYYASYTYHILVTEQLKAIYYLTGDSFFYNIYIKWDRYPKSILNRIRVMINKTLTSNKFLNSR